MTLSKVMSLTEDQEYSAWQVPVLSTPKAFAGVRTEPARASAPAATNEGLAPTSTDHESELQQAYQQGLADAQKQLMTDQQSQAVQLQAVLQALSRPLERINDAVEAELVELALAVARLILRQELSADSSRMVSLVHDAIKQLPASSLHVKVHLNPGDVLAVKAALGETEQADLWQLEADASLQSGDCQIYTETSFVDAGVDGLVKRLATDMLGAHRTTDMTEQQVKEHE